MARLLIAGSPEFVGAPVRMLLEAKGGYQVKSCERLQEAVALVLEDPPDLLLVEKDFAGDGDRQLVRAVASCLQKANIPILLAINEQDLAIGLSWRHYPVDDFVVKPFAAEVLLARLQLAEARMVRVFDNNPLSRLPGNTSILRAIRQTLSQEENYGVCYVDIDNFKPYNDRYGFARGDEVILMVARIIVNVVEEKAREGSFVGHVGGDDFVFIVREEKAEEVCRQVLANFSLVRNMFLSAEDIAAGEFIGKDRLDQETRFPLLSLSIAVLLTGKGSKYRHSGEVSAAASQLKHYVKKLEGSNYLIDRRESADAATPAKGGG